MSQLIVVTGPPCSGKSTLAMELGAIFGAVVLDIDQIRQAVIPNSQQSQEDRDVAYRCMHLIAQKLIEAGANQVVLTATYSRRNPRQWLGSLAEKTSAPVCAIACKVNPEIAVARFRSRKPGHPALDLTEDLVQRQVRDYQYGLAKVVDCAVSLHESVSIAEHYVGAGNAVDLVKWSSEGASAHDIVRPNDSLDRSGGRKEE
jgi:predicted kinase